MIMKTTVYFRNGHVISMRPYPITSYYEARQQIYGCDYIVSDGKKYDLGVKEQIYDIQIPNYESADQNNRVSIELGSTGYLEYVLRMKASQYKNLGNDDLAYACLGQATKLMLYSDMGWPEKEYWRIVDWLEKDGRFKLAAKWEDWIQKYVPTLADIAADRFFETVKTCQKIGTGLIQFSWEGARCGTVSKYQGRVYSLPGVRSNFPVLPDFIMETGIITPQQPGSVYPFTLWNDPSLDRIYYKGTEQPALRTSWRSFVDDRSSEEKANYQKLQFDLLEKEHKEKNRRAYIRLQYAFPDLCPARLSTFYSWERTHPDKHNIIVKAAQEAGLVVPIKEFVMPKDIEPEDPDPSYCGGRKKPLVI